MRPHSQQILSVEEAFGRNGWHCELVEGREVIRAGFDAHHTRVDLVAQAYPQLNALSVVTETPLRLDGFDAPLCPRAAQAVVGWPQIAGVAPRPPSCGAARRRSWGKQALASAEQSVG